MNLNQQDARKWILGLWFLLVAVQVAREFQGMAGGSITPDTRPFPRPCVLLGGAAAYTVLGVFAELLPGIAVLTAVGITLGALIAPGLKGQPTPIKLLDQAVQKLQSLGGG